MPSCSPFSTAYLPGYLADKYDVTIDDSRDRADTRCRETLAQALRDTVTGYGACVTEREDIAAAARQGALRPAAGLDAEHEVARARTSSSP